MTRNTWIHDGLRAATVITVGLLLSAQAAAQSRWVYVNGQRLSDAQVADLSRKNCAGIPNGMYWLNTQTGAWGYAGNPQVQGVFGASCAGGGAAASTNPDGTIGPFVSMGRAETEANKFRAQGYRVAAFHNGDGYYIRVSR